MKTSPIPRLRDALRDFEVEIPIESVMPLGGGHIHRTWDVTTVDRSAYVLQELNNSVFTDLEACEENLRRLDDHFHERIEEFPISIPKHLRTRHNCLHAVIADGSTWRATFRVNQSVAPSHLAGPDDAYAAASAFGAFASALRSMPGPRLHATIPRFHDFEWRREQLGDAVRADHNGLAGSVRGDVDEALSLARELGGSAAQIAANAIHGVHNDAKVTNLLCSAMTGRPMAVVDLDTTMPGSALVDLGELVRSGACEQPEDSIDVDAIDVRRGVVAALIEGFRDSYQLDDVEVSLIRFAGPVLAVENGMRFLADHLNGDVYFHITRPAQNLDRARMQFRLARQLLRT